jgi:repressor LexA
LREGRSPSVRELARALSYKSPRSAAVLIDRLIELGLLTRKSDGALQLLEPGREFSDGQATVRIPIVGAVACGAPLLAEENIEAYLQISTALAPTSHRHFLLRAVGDSMDEAGINDGDLVLVRQAQAAETGQIVVALLDGEATVKVLIRTSTGVVLQPRSSNEEHQPILLSEDFAIQGHVVGTIPREDQESLWL